MREECALWLESNPDEIGRMEDDSKSEDGGNR
jgi:hypothetical protein